MSKEVIATPETGLITMIERVAMSPDADIAKLEKMLDMQERVLDRQSKQAFAADMAAMQADLPIIAETSSGHNNKYAKFDSIIAKVRPIMQVYGFAVAFEVDQSQDKMIKVTAKVTHKDGHSDSTSIALPADSGGSKNAVQAIGSTVSYGKRYTFCALLNIATGEDDDAQSAVEFISETQLADLKALLSELKRKEADFAKYLKVPAIAYLPAKDYKRAIKVLQDARAKQ